MNQPNTIFRLSSLSACILAACSLVPAQAETVAAEAPQNPMSEATAPEAPSFVPVPDLSTVVTGEVVRTPSGRAEFRALDSVPAPVAEAIVAPVAEPAVVEREEVPTQAPAPAATAVSMPAPEPAPVPEPTSVSASMEAPAPEYKVAPMPSQPMPQPPADLPSYGGIGMVGDPWTSTSAAGMPVSPPQPSASMNYPARTAAQTGLAPSQIYPGHAQMAPRPAMAPRYPQGYQDPGAAGRSAYPDQTTPQGYGTAPMHAESAQQGYAPRYQDRAVPQAPTAMSRPYAGYGSNANAPDRGGYGGWNRGSGMPWSGGNMPWGGGPGGWMNPGDPKGMMNQGWNNMMQAPGQMGGPSISVPSPVDVGDQFGTAARQVPGQIGNFGGMPWNGGQTPRGVGPGGWSNQADPQAAPAANWQQPPAAMGNPGVAQPPQGRVGDAYGAGGQYAPGSAANYGGMPRSAGGMPWSGSSMPWSGGSMPWGGGPGGWMNPSDPKGMMNRGWDSMLNSPSQMGAPSVSVPSPFDVGEQFGNAGQDMPGQMGNFWGSQ